VHLQRFNGYSSLKVEAQMLTTHIYAPIEFKEPAPLLKPAPRMIPLDAMRRDGAVRLLADRAVSQVQMPVRFVLIEADTILTTHLADRDRITIGRGNPDSNEKIDLDLMAHGGREKGVSRLHAILYRVGSMLSIIDLGSTNGTYRNGMRLLPNQPRVLIDGDELCLGNMLFHIHFGY
jgi:hypothetical protein